MLKKHLTTVAMAVGLFILGLCATDTKAQVTGVTGCGALIIQNQATAVGIYVGPNIGIAEDSAIGFKSKLETRMLYSDQNSTELSAVSITSINTKNILTTADNKWLFDLGIGGGVWTITTDAPGSGGDKAYASIALAAYAECKGLLTFKGGVDFLPVPAGNDIFFPHVGLELSF